MPSIFRIVTFEFMYLLRKGRDQKWLSRLLIDGFELDQTVKTSTLAARRLHKREYCMQARVIRDERIREDVVGVLEHHDPYIDKDEDHWTPRGL